MDYISREDGCVTNMLRYLKLPSLQQRHEFMSFMFFSVLRLFCLCVRLFICALWLPAGKGLTSWFSFVVSYCEFVTFPLVWSGVVLNCIVS